MAHQILHWNGFDAGSSLSDEYSFSEFGTDRGYFSSYGGISSPYYGYGKFVHFGNSDSTFFSPEQSRPSGSPAACVQFLFAFPYQTTTQMVRFYDSVAGGDQITINSQWSSPSHNIVVRRGSTTLGTINAVAGVGQWNWMSVLVYVHNSQGRVVIRMGFNDQIVFTFNGNTQNTANQRIDRIDIGNIGSNHDVCYDDLVFSVCDPADPPMFRYRVIGAQRASASDLSGFSVFGAATNWQAVSEANEDGDSTYVFASQPGTRDSYQVEIPTTTKTIIAVKSQAICRKNEAGVARLVPEIRKGGTSYGAPPVVLEQHSNYRMISGEWFSDPSDGRPWTPSRIQGLRTGFRIF